MIVQNRRRLLQGLGAVICAPAIVRASSLMPVKAIKPPRLAYVVSENISLADFENRLPTFFFELRGDRIEFIPPFDSPLPQPPAMVKRMWLDAKQVYP